MNRTILLIALAASLLFSCKREVVPPPPPEQAISKTATFQLYATEDYSAPSYQNVEAQIRLQLRKVNYRTGASELVWDSTLAARKLPDFPLVAGKQVFTKTVPVLESSEKLNASFSIVYKEGAIVHQYGESKEAVPGTMSVLLNINP